MPNAMRVLLIENSEEDTNNILFYLRKHFGEIVYKRIVHADAMQQALIAEIWDIIISDFSLPEFTAHNIIAVLKESNLDIPLVFVAGNIGEETAVELVKAGASDYIAKDHLNRLVPTVQREMNAASSRLVQKHVNEKVRKLSMAVEQSPNIVLIMDTFGVIDYVNPTFTEISGYSLAEINSQNISILKPDHQSMDEYLTFWEEIMRRDEWRGEIECQKKDGQLFLESAVICPIQDVNDQITHYVKVAEDITARKRAERIRVATYKISEATNSAQNLNEFFELTHKIIGELMPADNFYIVLYDRKRRLINYPYFVDQREKLSPEERTTRLGRGLTEYVLRTGESLLATAQVRDELIGKGEVIAQGPPAVDWLGVPLKVKNETMGVLVVQSYVSTTRFGEEEKNILLFVSTQLSLAIARKKSEEALRESEERYALVAQGVSDGLWDWDLKSDRVYYSPRWKAMMGLRDDDEFETIEDWFDRVHEEDADKLKNKIQSHLTRVESHFQCEYRVRHVDGTLRWMLSRGVAVRNNNGEAYRMAGSQTDITERKRAESQLIHDAFHDALTGLPNRNLFMDRVGTLIIRTRRTESYEFGVLFIDIDNFKNINDSMGHTTGDHLLIEVTRRLQKCLRLGDTVARMGGDEFGIIVDDAKEPDEVLRVADRIQNSLKIPFDFDEKDVYLTASIGIALSAAGYERPEDLLRDVDTALYRAKAAGRNRQIIFDATMHEHAVKRLQTETDLRRAIERHEFRLFFQPIIALSTSKIVGFEALVRWQHPHHGLVSPFKFIQVAEETGLIIPIGIQIFEAACKQIKQWHSRFQCNPPISISINLSSRQFLQQDLVQQIDKIRHSYDLEAKYIKLEITESAVMENAAAVSTMLNELRDLNFQLCIDDFGTGYSSLSYLHSFPIHTLKIDQSFVFRVNENGENGEIIRTIILLAHSMGMDVIAEGVETPAHARLLRQLGCEYAQGYLFSRPVDSDSATDLLERQQSGPLFPEYV